MKVSWDGMQQNGRKWEATLFLGEFKHALDAKGRAIIPSKFRDEIGEQKLVVMPGPDKNLVVYTEKDFQQFATDFLERSSGTADYRGLRRFIASNAESLELDKQGRILLSAKLRNYAGLTKDIVVNGNLTNFEIWDLERWEGERNFGDAEVFAKIVEEMDIRI